MSDLVLQSTQPSVSLGDFDAQNRTLSSPYRNFTILERNNLARINEKKANCGVDKINFINSSTLEQVFFPVYCDNRSCPICKDHKKYKFRKTHHLQILALNKSMENPRAWVFTGWVMPIEELTREFCQDKIKKLFKLLKQYSASEFSIHMEIKIQKNGFAYLHFHVVSAYIKNIRLVSKLWGRKIRNELAILPDNLGFYVSKYASKVPYYPTVSHEAIFSVLVYKLQMHRFSPKIEHGIPSLTYTQQIEIIKKANLNIERPDWSILNVKSDNILDIKPKPPDLIKNPEIPILLEYRKRYSIKKDKTKSEIYPTFYIEDILDYEIARAYHRDTDKYGNPKDYHPFLYRNAKQINHALHEGVSA